MKKLLDKERKAYLNYLEKVRGYSDLTLKSYDESIQEALLYIEITQEDDGYIFNLMPYRIHISGLNAKTISKKLSAIRGFVNYLNENAFSVTLQADESVKTAKTLPKPISHEHILEAIEHTELYNKTIVVLLYTLGLRISELASIRLEDISEEWIRVVGKGSKMRDIPLLGSTKRVLEEYLQTFAPKKFLFEKKGEKLSENSLRYLVNKVFNDVGLKVTPHQLRHSYATALLNGGAPIVDVSELLGHTSMATTQIYTKLGSALKRQNYNKAHPLCSGDE